MSEHPLKRFVITARGSSVISFGEEYIPPPPLVTDDDGQIVFRDMTRRKVAGYPRAQFEPAHAALSWLVFLAREKWFTSLHLSLLLCRLGVGLPTVDGICDPAETACRRPEPASKRGTT